MRFLGNLLVRLVTILFGLAMAFLAASAFLGFGFLNHFMDPDIIRRESADSGFIALLIALFWSPFIAAAAFGPALLVICVAELGRWRGFVANMLLGAAAAMISFWLADNHAAGEGISQGTLVILLSTGFIGGAVYWVFSGRKAGDWLA